MKTLSKSQRSCLAEHVATMGKAQRAKLALRVILARIARTEITAGDTFDTLVSQWVRADGAAAVYNALCRDVRAREAVAYLDRMITGKRRDDLYSITRFLLLSVAA